MPSTRRTSALLAAALLVACVDEDVGRDRDNDGFQTWELGGDDCDDSNANINPSVSELCGNGLDDDCDGFIDNEGVGEREWYLDEDGDGYAQAEPVITCAQPEGALADLSAGVDCDDTNNRIHPGATEIWYDGIDQACDGGNDYDADGDEYDGVEGGGDDCDDSRDDVNPGSIELCGNGIDDDCDGTPNQCEWRGELEVEDIATAVFPVHADRVWFDDYTGDSIGDVLLFRRSDAFTGEAAILHLYEGPFSGGEEATVSASWELSDGSAGSWQILATEDFNGDAIPDILVPVASGDGSTTRGVGLYASPHEGRTHTTPDAVLTSQWDGSASNMRVRNISPVRGLGGAVQPGLFLLFAQSVPSQTPNVSFNGPSEAYVLTAAQVVAGGLVSHGIPVSSPDLEELFYTNFDDPIQLGVPFPAITRRRVEDQQGLRDARDIARITIARASVDVDATLSIETVHSDVGYFDIFPGWSSGPFDLTGDGGLDWFVPAQGGRTRRGGSSDDWSSAIAFGSSSLSYLPPPNRYVTTPTSFQGVARVAVCDWLADAAPERLELHTGGSFDEDGGFIADPPRLWVGSHSMDATQVLEIAQVPGVVDVMCPAEPNVMFLVQDTSTALAVPQGR